MADETRSAEVQLTADISGYTQPVAQATQQTNKLTDSVNKLAASLDGITKRAGKKLIIFGAADTAAMTAYVAVAAKYEKQLTTLRAQTELSGKSLQLYKKGIEDIARQMPISGAAVTALVTQINQLGVTSERQATQMARTFTQLAAATGEDIGALTQGLIELSRQMGTLGNGAMGVNNFADSLTTVSNQAGVSATAVLSFAQAIAPMARAAGIGQKEVLGISTAFTKAGADGFAAANTFNSMVTDITRQVMSGSPEIAKYAAAVGATVEQFKQMDATERIVQIFEAVTKAGPDAVKLIDRLGYDGIRAAKSIQAVANESGGLRRAIEESVGAYGSGSTAKGADAAFSSLDAQMTKFRNNIEQIGVAIGQFWLTPLTKFMEYINRALDGVNKLAGPLLTIAGAIGGIVGPLSMAFGGLMTMMGPLSTLMLAMTAFRLSPIRAMIQGVKEGAAQSTAARYGTPYVPTTSAGQRMAPGGQGMPIFRRAPYSLGERIGGMLPVGTPGVPNTLGQLALRSGVGAANMVSSWYIDPTKQMIRNAAMADPLDRVSVFGKYMDDTYERVRGRSASFGSIMGSAISDPRAYLAARRGPLQAPMAHTGIPLSEMAKAHAEANAENAYRSFKPGDDPYKVISKANFEYADTMREYSKEAEKAATTSKEVARANGMQVKSIGDLRNAMARMAFNAAGLPVAYGRMGVGLAGQAIGRVGGGLLSSIGGMVGGGAGTGAALVGAAAIGYGVYQTRQGTTANIINDETQTNLARINASLGLAAESLGDFAKKVEDSSKATKDLKTAADGFALSYSERANARSGEFSDERVGNLGSPEAAIAFLKSMGELNGEQARALALDIAKQFGAQTSQYITQAYMSQTKGANFDQMTFGGIGNELFAAGAAQTNQGIVGGLRNIGLSGLVGVDTSTTEAVQAAWLGAREQSYRVGQTYGPEAQAAKQAANAVALLNSAFGQGSSAGAREVQSQSVKQWEAIYGELGLSQGSQGLTSAWMGGQSLNTTEDFLKYVTDPSNTSEGARAFRESLQSAGLGASDLYGPQAKSLDELAIQMQRGNLSDYERNVRGTALGKYARTTQSVLDVTEGVKVGDNTAVGKAVMDLYDQMTASGQSFENVTAQANKLAAAAGSATDPLYQLAMAAKDLAYSRGLTQAGQQGGMVGSFQFRLNQNAQNLQNATSDTDIVALEKERDALEQEGYAAAVAYESALYEYQKSTLRARQDFHKQMLYAEEDFARSMSRAAEDAAKSMYDPFRRSFNTGSVGLDSVLSNMRRHQQLLADQVKNIQKLRQMGFSQEAIDTMDLTNPANAYRVQRFIDGGVSRKQAREANRLARQTVGSAGDLLDTQEGTRRAYEDFARSQNRAQDNFAKQMKRALEDLQDYGREVYGDFDKIMDKVQKRMDKVMPGVESDFYKKLVEIGDAIVGRESLDSETGRARNKADAANRTPGDGNRTYDPDTGDSYYQAGRGTTTRRKPKRYGDPILGQGGSDPQAEWAARVRAEAGYPAMASGGVVKGLTLAMMGELARPEMVVPLHGAEGKEYIASMAAQISTHMVKGMHTAGKGSPTVYRGSNMTINNHTEFRDIKVVAQDPNEMARQLKERERRENMRKGANARI